MSVTFSGLKQFYKDQQFYYTDELLFNIYCSLKTKPFIILSGISGSGKSKIIDLLATYYSKELSYENNYELVPVKPNWMDSRAVFGYHNIIDNTYSITPIIKLFLRALNDPSKPYFLVLDEMNLAKVEHYFSDFLSLIESRKNVITVSDSVSFTFKESKLSDIPSLTLPDLTLISAIDLDLFTNYASVPDIRNSRLYKIWTDNNPDELAKPNWTPRSRSEINNKVRGQPGRFCSKFFMTSENDDEMYRFRTQDEIRDLMDTMVGEPSKTVLTQNEVDRFEALINKYFDRTTIPRTNPDDEIIQEPIILHNSKLPLKVDLSQEDYIDNKLLYEEDTDNYYVPNKIEIPLNLFVVGTVNIDETTYMFSPKVLDRSNVLEFNDIDLYGAYQYALDNTISTERELTLDDDELNLEIKLPTSKETIWVSTNYPTEFKVLFDIFELLKNRNKHFGYRVFNEISSYVKIYVSHSATDVEIAFDNQILQKVLPKLNGDEGELGNLLFNLKETIPDTFSKSVQKLDEMIETLENTGYVTFIK